MKPRIRQEGLDGGKGWRKKEGWLVGKALGRLAGVGKGGKGGGRKAILRKGKKEDGKKKKGM